MINLFDEAYDGLNSVDRELSEPTHDQRLKMAEIKALLAIAQELSKIHNDGINPTFENS